MGVSGRKVEASFWFWTDVRQTEERSPYGLEFVYENWRGVTHTYIVRPDNIEWARYWHEDADRRQGEETWLMNAWVISRSGEDRPGRRTFIMSKMKHVREVRL